MTAAMSLGRVYANLRMILASSGSDALAKRRTQASTMGAEYMTGSRRVLTVMVWGGIATMTEAVVGASSMLTPPECKGLMSLSLIQNGYGVNMKPHSICKSAWSLLICLRRI